MESGNPEADLIRNGILTIRGGVIEYVGRSVNYTLPTGATVIDAEGGADSDCLSVCLCVLTMSTGYIVPGFIDAHAHWGGYADRFPAKSWEMQTFLAYGVTTLHKYVI